MQVAAKQNEALDEICWRALGRSAEVTEQALMANPGLADLGPLLPAGTIVTLPDVVADQAPVVELVQLWD